MGKHSQDDALAHRRARIGGIRGAQLRRQVAAADAVMAADAVQLVDRTEAPDIDRVTRRAQQATDIAWPTEEAGQVTGSAIRVNRCNEPANSPGMHRITDHTSTKGEEE